MNRSYSASLSVTKMLRVIFFTIGLFNSTISSAQEDELNKLPDDTAKVNRMTTYARQLFNNQPEAADRLMATAEKISERLHYHLGLAAIYTIRAAQACNRMELDSARILNDKALKYVGEAKSETAKNQLAGIYNNYGVIYQQQQMYDSAAAMYLQVVKVCDETGNHNRKTAALYNLSILYSFIQDTVKTDRYARLAVDESKLTADTALMLRTSLALLNNFSIYKTFDSILPYARPALVLAEKKNDFYSKAKILLFIGDCYKENKSTQDSAHWYFQQSLQIARKLGSPYDMSVVLLEIGNAYIIQKENAKAIPYLEQALKITSDENLLQFKTMALKSLAEAESNIGHMDKAFAYLNDYVLLNDSLAKKANENAVQMLETRYQLQKKENTIALQKNDIRQKNTINYILFGTAAALLVIFLLAYRNYRHRQKLQQVKIDELETEKQLTATEAVLKGEEQERTRLAKDLHDGLGGMLSGIKFSLSNIKGNLVMTPDNAQSFERSIDMLDSSIREMRRVAHNMMPEVLVKYGLDIALKEFCDEITSSGVIHTNYLSLNMNEMKIPQTTAVTIYRIVQELVNNVIKHAGAKNILVQAHLSIQEKSLAITVEDDGKGFDINGIGEQAGIGWKNIRNRVEFLKARLDVQSAPDKGTSVMIETNIT